MMSEQRGELEEDDAVHELLRELAATVTSIITAFQQVEDDLEHTIDRLNLLRWGLENRGANKRGDVSKGGQFSGGPPAGDSPSAGTPTHDDKSWADADFTLPLIPQCFFGCDRGSLETVVVVDEDGRSWPADFCAVHASEVRNRGWVFTVNGRPAAYLLSEESSDGDQPEAGEAADGTATNPPPELNPEP